MVDLLVTIERHNINNLNRSRATTSKLLRFFCTTNLNKYIMQQLRSEFTGRGQVKGFMFTQLEQSKHGYIYSVDTGDSVHFEVFKHVENRRYECVSYPTDNGFGVWAWSFNTLEKATEKFDDLELIFLSKVD